MGIREIKQRLDKLEHDSAPAHDDLLSMLPPRQLLDLYIETARLRETDDGPAIQWPASLPKPTEEEFRLARERFEKLVEHRSTKAACELMSMRELLVLLWQPTAATTTSTDRDGMGSPWDAPRTAVVVGGSDG